MRISEFRRTVLLFMLGTRDNSLTTVIRTVTLADRHASVIRQLEAFSQKYAYIQDRSLTWEECNDIANIIFAPHSGLNERETHFISQLRLALWGLHREIDNEAVERKLQRADAIYQVFRQFYFFGILQTPYCEAVIHHRHPTEMGQVLLELFFENALSPTVLLFLANEKRPLSLSKDVLWRLKQGGLLQTTVLNFLNSLELDFLKHHLDKLIDAMLDLRIAGLLDHLSMNGIMKARYHFPEYANDLLRLHKAGVFSQQPNFRDTIVLLVDNRLNQPDRTNFVNAVICLFKCPALYSEKTLKSLRDAMNPDMVAEAMVILLELGMPAAEISRLAVTNQIPFYYKNALERLLALSMPSELAQPCVGIIFSHKTKIEFLMDCIELIVKSGHFTPATLEILSQMRHISLEHRTQLTLLRDHHILTEPVIVYVLSHHHVSLSSFMILLAHSNCLTEKIMMKLASFDGSISNLYAHLTDQGRGNELLTEEVVLNHIHQLNKRGMPAHLHSLFAPLPSPTLPQKTLHSAGSSIVKLH